MENVLQNACVHDIFIRKSQNINMDTYLHITHKMSYILMTVWEINFDNKCVYMFVVGMNIDCVNACFEVKQTWFGLC